MPEILRDYMATAAHITQDIAPTTTAVTAPARPIAALPSELSTTSSSTQASAAPRVRQHTRRDFLVGSGIAALAGTGLAVTAAPIAHAQTGVAPVPHMRRTELTQGIAASALPNLPTLGIIALNRMGYGARPGDLAAFNALAPTPDA